MKSRFMRSMLRTTMTFAGSYMGAKVMGWVFDTLVDRRR